MIRFTVMAAAYVECRHPQVHASNGARMDRVESIIEQFRQLPPGPMQTPPTRSRRWWFLLALVPLVIVATVVVSRDVDAGSHPETDWRAEVLRIDSARVQAFMQRDPDLLRSILIEDSPAYTHDVHVIDELRARNIVLDHNPFAVSSVTLLNRSTTDDVDHVRLQVVDRLAAHTFTAHSTVLVRSDGRDERTWVLELRRQGDAPWRLYATTATASKSSIPTSDQGR